MANSMLSEYNVMDSFWAEVINTTCHASNRLYYHRLLKKTPNELLIGRKPNISYFWVFGCKCYILRRGTRLSKFQCKCDECFLLGYSLNSKAYRVYNQSSGLVEETEQPPPAPSLLATGTGSSSVYWPDHRLLRLLA
jgi:hypothetical protein